jgi:hypothetical protein
MKRVFLVFLFALTALSFSACSSSDNDGGGGNGGGGEGKQSINGKVILPEGYAAKVFVDTNGSGVLDGEETGIDAALDGTFSIQAGAGERLAAKLTKAETTGTTVLSELSSTSNTPIYYTTPYKNPAEVKTLSSLSTLVKNKMDLEPRLTVGAAAVAVKADTGLTADILSEEAAGDTAVIALNAKLAGITQRTAAFILNELGAEASVDSAVVTLLYSAINNILSVIIANIENDTVVDNAIQTDIGDVEAAIGEIEAAFDSKWDPLVPIALYLPDSDHTICRFDFNNNVLQVGPYTPISSLKSGPTLPPSGNEFTIPWTKNSNGELTYSDDGTDYRIGGFSVSSSFREDLNGKQLTASTGKTINFTEGAYSYTLLRYDTIHPIPAGTDKPIAYIKSHFADVLRYTSQWTDIVLKRANISSQSAIGAGVTLGMGDDSARGVITIAGGTAFSWAQVGACVDQLFSSCYVSPKNGVYSKTGGAAYPDHSAEYTFTAYDGTVWYLFYANADLVRGVTDEDGDNVSEGWYIYQWLHDPVYDVFFNDIAAKDIIVQW